MSAKQPSKFQQAITGEWHGLPSVFDAEGNHTGFNKVNRASVFEGDRTTYWMETNFRNSGPLRNRFDTAGARFEFGVIDSDSNRVYCGPDFVGSGRPYGLLVDSNYYSPGWNTDLRTVNLILPKQGLQVYSSQLFEADTLVAVFNGLYVVTQDHADNKDSQAFVENFLQQEQQRASAPFILPVKLAGQWRGEFEVYDEHQELLGTSAVIIDYHPTSLTSAKVTVHMTGVINRTFSYQRSRTNQVHKFEGPDVFGNGRAYGRYLWSTQHFYGEPFKLKSRDTLLDENFTLCSVWNFYQGNKEKYTAFGVLDWHPGDNVLKANYASI